MNRELVRDIYKWKEEDKEGVQRSNRHGWHSMIIMHLREEFDKITNAINDAQQSYQHKKVIIQTELNCRQYVGKRIALRNMHIICFIHFPNALWSGVYYVQCPEDCGRIKFLICLISITMNSI